MDRLTDELHGLIKGVRQGSAFDFSIDCKRHWSSGQANSEVRLPQGA